VAESHQITGIFRDRGQAQLAVAEARRQGLDVHEPELLTEDSDGVHVILLTTEGVEDARRLLLEYGAYRASVLQPGAG
jgi:hypothetical protein